MISISILGKKRIAAALTTFTMIPPKAIPDPAKPVNTGPMVTQNPNPDDCTIVEKNTVIKI